jgi:hypothetical protein
MSRDVITYHLQSNFYKTKAHCSYGWHAGGLGGQGGHLTGAAGASINQASHPVQGPQITSLS